MPMKKVALIACLTLLMGGLAYAKVNFSGDFQASYKAQEFEVVTTGPTASGTLTENTYGNKTFDMEYLRLNMDAVVSDNVIAFAEIVYNDDDGSVTMDNVWAQVNLTDWFRVKAGKFDRPFGEEYQYAESISEVFALRSIVQDANGALLSDTIGSDSVNPVPYELSSGLNGEIVVGAQINGDYKMASYALWVENGALPALAVKADSTDYSVQSTPSTDNDDAKSVGLSLRVKPLKDLQIGADYVTGDYRHDKRAKGFNLNFQYDLLGQFLLRGEYADIEHEDYLADVSGDSVDAEYKYYIAEVTYHGLKDWQFGVRYSAIDPDNETTEEAANFEKIEQYQFAVQYNISEGAYLKAEYAIRDTDRKAGFYGATTNDPDDDLFVVQLAVEF